MNRNQGAATIALVLAALVGMSYLPKGDRGTENASSKGVESTASRTNRTRTIAAGAPTPSEACTEIGGLLARFYDGFEKVPYPQSCFDPGVKAPQPIPTKHLKLKLVIALLPNPVSTHFSLFFDRGVEAIQQAAQDEGYSYDSSWLPWSDELREYTHLADDISNTKRRHAIETQPGLMVFRRGVSKEGEPSHPYSEGLVVLLVGEQPTRGIADEEFENAMLWFSNLAPLGSNPQQADPLRILGPTTSGALPSLHRELEQNCDKWWRRPPVVVYSGTVSSPDNVAWFRNAMKDLTSRGADPAAFEDKPPPICKVSTHEPEFRTYNESDELLTNRFCSYLVQQEYDLSKLAVLSEDETAFGTFKDRSARKESCGRKPLHVYYPRDIAALQSAYEKQSVFATGKPAANAPGSTLRSDLSEPTGGEHDTVRAYGGQLDPLSQEVVLQGIVERLRALEIQFVLVRSSNTLDQAFLSQFLRRSYPEGRVVLDTADLLFLRSRQDVSLRGTMALTTYPLLAYQQQWTPTLRNKENQALRVFAQDSAESIYLAARNLIGPGSETKSSVPINDYLPPRWASKTKPPDDPKANSRPATWLTVISRRRFWPVAALTAGTAGPVGADGSLLPVATDAEKKNGTGQAALILFPLQMKVLMLLCSTLAMWHLYCCWFGSVTGPLRALSYFAPLPMREHRQLVFVGSLIIGLLGVVLAIFGGMSVNSELSTRLWWLLFGSMTCLLLFPTLSLVGNFSLPRLRNRKEREHQETTYFNRWQGWPARFVKWHSLILLGVAVLAALLVGYAVFLQLFLIDQLTDANRFPVIWRSVNLLSGVSPLMPQVLMLFGLYGWFWCNLSGAALMGDDRPRLPKEAHFPPQSLDATLPEQQRRSLFRRFSREEAQRPVEQQSMPLGRLWWHALAACFVATAVVFRVALRDWGVRSLGEMHYGYVIFWWLVILVAMLLADMVQLLRTWGQLHKLLTMLDRLRLRRTLAAMKRIAWRSVWGMSGNVLEERHRVMSRQVESLRNLRNELNDWECAGEDEEARQAAIKRIDTCMVRGTAFFQWYVGLSDQRKRGLSFEQWWKERERKERKEQESEEQGNKEQERKGPTWRSYAQWWVSRIDCRLVSDVGPMSRFQAELAESAAVIIGGVLLTKWRKEKESLLIEHEGSKEGEHEVSSKQQLGTEEEPCSVVRAAEEFFLLHYLGFLQNTLGRIRSMVLGMLMLFVATTLAVSCYPFDPLPVLGGLFLAVFIVVGTAVVSVYASMHRDNTLSYVTNTNPDELGWEFWGHLVTFGIGPLFALLTTLFPSMTDFLVSWLQPSSQALR